MLATNFDAGKFRVLNGNTSVMFNFSSYSSEMYHCMYFCIRGSPSTNRRHLQDAFRGLHHYIHACFLLMLVGNGDKAGGVLCYNGFTVKFYARVIKGCSRLDRGWAGVLFTIMRRKDLYLPHSSYPKQKTSCPSNYIIVNYESLSQGIIRQRLPLSRKRCRA